jgi:hypothetical protein
VDVEGKIQGVLTAVHTERYESRPGVQQSRTVDAYYLDERNALRVIRPLIERHRADLEARFGAVVPRLAARLGKFRGNTREGSAAPLGGRVPDACNRERVRRMLRTRKRQRKDDYR